MERRHPDPHRAAARKPSLSPRSLRAQDRSRGAPSRHGSPAPALVPCNRKTGENTRGVCGVPSERSVCAPYPGFHPGLVCDAPLGRSERLTFPEPSCTSTKRSGTGPERALERRHPDPHRAAARKPSLSPRSLRAQDRSRRAYAQQRTKKPPPFGANFSSLEIIESVPFCVNRWD